MEKIKVTICTGTTCFVMGAGDLLAIGDHLGDDLKDKIELSGSTCLDLCKNGQFGKAPFAKVNETIIAEATITKVAEAIRKEL